ncbi:hypothetical protein M3223_14260 [Paenibacillus pasadenensis]|nr:hypothetical protein [Paenibacillus pasadenensis]
MKHLSQADLYKNVLRRILAVNGEGRFHLTEVPADGRIFAGFSISHNSIFIRILYAKDETRSQKG